MPLLCFIHCFNVCFAHSSLVSYLPVGTAAEIYIRCWFTKIKILYKQDLSLLKPAVVNYFAIQHAVTHAQDCVSLGVTEPSSKLLNIANLNCNVKVRKHRHTHI